ncbi:oral-facial-digital syndrome 1 protein [Elysia marginata]|uniref:Oral-facial-digital syndrome 1 protein n=1 Tax=Elysia marginata TaxID=1093978 RepID=A0AAV4FXS4_9GAST|nr:oral-facial-digital syndrome 1 protein [Elysia marginata]
MTTQTRLLRVQRKYIWKANLVVVLKRVREASTLDIIRVVVVVVVVVVVAVIVVVVVFIVVVVAAAAAALSMRASRAIAAAVVVPSQLRNSLVTELQQSVRGPLTLKDLKTPEEGSLLHRASNSLVANHLRACQYEYSLSVFLPECGLSQDKKFETSDLLKLLNISPQSRLYQRLASHTEQESKKGFLWQLLSEVSSLHANSINTIGCQTDLIKMGPVTPLDEKLSDVDELYSSRREEFLRTGRAGAEERLLSFQRQLEDRYNTQLKMEIARMRDAEISTIKMNEKENSRKALEQARRELERSYKDKHDALVNRERNASERLQQQTEIQERETFAQRQTILEEIEAVRQREAEVKREAEVNEREKKLAEKRVKDKEEEIRRRELEVKQKENSFEQRLQNEMAQFKLDQQARYIERVQNVEVREATLKEARYSEVNANKNNEYLNAKLRDMSDYKTLKEQVVLYRNELETVRTRLAEVLSMNERERGRQEELLRELRRPSPESLMLHRDFERCKEELRQEQTLFGQQKQLLEARLKEELDRNRDLVRRFEEQNLQMREMNREVVDLRQSLHMTTKALNNEVYGKPNDEENGDMNESRQSGGTPGPSLGKPSPASGYHRKSPAPGHVMRKVARNVGPGLRLDFDTKDVYHDVDSDIVSVSQCRDGLFLEDDEMSSADSADIIAQAKYRLRSLDKEAHNLERAYHNFHCRVTNVNALSNDEPIQDRGHEKNTAQGSKQRHQKLNMESPRQSPIPFVNQLNPMSSTPYKQEKTKPQELNESFTELATQSGRFQPSTELLDRPSHGGRETAAAPDIAGDTMKVKTRSITMDDLERRPGSPEIMVVPGSLSSDEGAKPHKAEPAASAVTVGMKATPAPESSQQTSLQPTPSGGVSAPQFSLDAAWKSQLQEEEEKEQEAKKRQREMEEQLEREEERKRNEERREVQRREEEEAARAKQEAEKAEEDKIDPVMKQYMAMVQQQKEQEKQVPVTQ